MKIFIQLKSAAYCGELRVFRDSVRFTYDEAYRTGDERRALGEELPLLGDAFAPVNAQPIHEPFRDASPDAWGRRVMAALVRSDRAPDDLSAFANAGHDRIGALFTERDNERPLDEVEPADLRKAVARVCSGDPLTAADADLLRSRIGVGGMRPKALGLSGGRPVIFKFAHPEDVLDIVRAEFVAMKLAAHCGIDVAEVELVKAGSDVALKVIRFDRAMGADGMERSQLASGLTMLHLDEMFASYASYQDVFKALGNDGTDRAAIAVELLKRMTLNVACGNTDDHARNISAFWDGFGYTLAPAYDICPQNRSGNVASQGMILSGRDRMSRLSGCVRAGVAMGLEPAVAEQVVAEVVDVVDTKYRDLVEEAGIGAVAARKMLGRQFLNPFIFEEWKSGVRTLPVDSISTG